MTSPIVSILTTVILSAVFQMSQPHDLPDLTSPNECHKFSLDAMAYQLYIPGAEKNLGDLKTFVNSALDSLLASVQQLMSMLPGKDKSDSQDFKVRSSFDLLRRGLDRVVKKCRRNLTQSWQDVLQANQGFINRTHTKPHLLINALKNLTDTYESARSATTGQLAVALLEPLKELVKRSAQSLDQMKQSSKVLSELMPNFLGTLTVRALEQKIDLEAAVKVPDLTRLHTQVEAREWQELLGKDLGTIQLLEAEVRVLLSDRRSRSPERLELSRRDLAVHWSHVAYEALTAEAEGKEPAVSDQVNTENRVLSLFRLYS